MSQDPTDPTLIRGVDSKTALYIDGQLDPIRTVQAIHGERISELNRKVETLFSLYNGGKKGAIATAGTGGIAGVAYLVIEFMKSAPQ